MVNYTLDSIPPTNNRDYYNHFVKLQLFKKDLYIYYIHTYIVII